MEEKTKVILVQLGSPKSPSVKDVRAFLREFLGDKRVVDINPFLWRIILNLFVLPFRPKNSARLYKRIWKDNSFPLIDYTIKFSNLVKQKLNNKDIDVEHAFLLSSPRISDVWDKVDENPEEVEKLLIIPLFPQYSESTIASSMDLFFNELKDRPNIYSFEFMTDFHRTKAFIDNSVRIIEENLESSNTDLIISFHGIPKRRVIYKGDRYYRHCFETFSLIKNRITKMDQNKIHMTFQSRFGSEEWLTPYTEDVAINLAKSGSTNIAVYCPSFVSDCLETIDEIGTELNEEVSQFNSKITAIPCLNLDSKWVEDFSSFVEMKVKSSKEDLDKEIYKLNNEDYKMMKEQKMEAPPLTDNAKSTLKLVFFTLFLDLVGFSIIFPLFPALAKHYLEVDSDNYFLRLIFDGIANFSGMTGNSHLSIVLFGGALGAIYSFLQFIASPLWGGLSDRIGRRPVLLISVFGLFLSYVLWFFSGSFTVLILARFIGGIMGGNISTATAVVADVTQRENRSRGMATIGIAFALGFIIGPAMGGLLSMIDLTQVMPSLVAYGVNPFSMAALLAGVLSLINFFLLLKNFKETLPEKIEETSQRVINPLKLFKPLPYKGVNATNIGHFLFLMAFSGMEFTLTFLAVERLNYTSMQNAYMFIFIGFIIALVQGGYVRRKANKVGEKKMALNGLITLVPGLLLIGYASSSLQIYAGLFFLSVGSSMVIPCLTSLVSLYTPKEEQGKSIGLFRSLGAFARVIGPMIAAIVYWRFGSHVPYIAGTIFLIIPILLVARLPKVEAI